MYVTKSIIRVYCLQIYDLCLYVDTTYMILFFPFPMVSLIKGNINYTLIKFEKYFHIFTQEGNNVVIT